MALVYKLDGERRLLITTVDGDVRLADVLDHLTKEREEQALGYVELVDATSATVQLSSNDVRSIVSVLRGLSRESDLGATAVVVPSDVGFGMMRMLGMLVDDFCQIAPFRSTKEAEKWLDQLQAKH